jgi:cytochrome c oxidase assembly factor CtaG
MAADTSWTFEPGAILLIAILGGLYLPRWRRVRRAHGPREAPIVRLLSYLAGLAMLIVGLTKVIMRPATRRLARLEQAAGPLGHPVFAVVLYVGLMWLWHVPALYDAALRHSLVHILEHVCFFSAGALYWWHLLSPIRSRLRLTGMGPVVYMLSTKLFVGLLGIGLTFAPDALYSFYERQPAIWGLNPAEDEALAGGLMALEQSIVMGVALVWLFMNALAESEAEEQRAERYA